MPPRTDAQTLQDVVASIQRRWGAKALRPASQHDSLVQVPALPTGYHQLDQLLEGGLPRGHMTELVGSFTCGAHTLALRAMASAQHMREPAVYFDLEHCFDPDYAAGCGVDMDKLIVVRPHAITEALDIAQEMIESGMSGILVWDSVEALLAAAGGRALFPAFLRRLVTPLAVSSGVMLVLNSPEVAGVEALKHHAALRLGCRTTRWLREYQDITGYETQVTVLKNRFGPEGDGVELRIAV